MVRYFSLLGVLTYLVSPAFPLMAGQLIVQGLYPAFTGMRCIETEPEDKSVWSKPERTAFQFDIPLDKFLSQQAMFKSSSFVRMDASTSAYCAMNSLSPILEVASYLIFKKLTDSQSSFQLMDDLLLLPSSIRPQTINDVRLTIHFNAAINPNTEGGPTFESHEICLVYMDINDKDEIYREEAVRIPFTCQGIQFEEEN